MGSGFCEGIKCFLLDAFTCKNKDLKCLVQITGVENKAESELVYREFKEKMTGENYWFMEKNSNRNY